MMARQDEWSRRRMMAGAGASLCALAAPRGAQAATTASFEETLRRLLAKARAEGVDQRLAASAVAGLRPDPDVVRLAAAQPEFETPIWAYVERAAGPLRVAAGRKADAAWARPLGEIVPRFGVPRQIVLAAWGMEADFSEPAQTGDVLRSLATLSWSKPGDPAFATEFVDALKMIQSGVARGRLRGSWAGAMGMPQFMPSAYLRYAVRFEGAGPADIWRSKPDALASIADFFAKSGWRKELPWGLEVLTPDGFDWRTLDAPLAEWARLGLRPADGAKLPRAGRGALFAPAGAAGPVFLLTDNFWVIKRYDNSDSYALALGLLADRIAGSGRLRRPWPARAALLDRDQRQRLQRGLARLGFYSGKSDGKIGPATREAVHKFQRAARLSPADGFATRRVLEALERAPSRAAISP